MPSSQPRLVREWIDDGVAATAIGIVACTGRDLEAVRDALDGEAVTRADIGSDSRKPGINVGTMHSSKGTSSPGSPSSLSPTPTTCRFRSP